jgi:hypothetical protein
MSLPPLLPVGDIQPRLQAIFPEGTPHRNNCTWDIAAKTVFVFLYVGALEDTGIWLRPDQVTRMTDEQAVKSDDADRIAWRSASLGSQADIAGRWYAVNTRESIRDDTLCMGLIANGAIVERQGLATTSPAPRYALQGGFATLFAPTLVDRGLNDAIEAWQAGHLNAAALARITLLRRGVAGGDPVLVKFPSGETRRLAPGPSSVLSKAVIEEFAPRFLKQPALLWLSESATKVVERDDDLAKAIGLVIQADKNLPDIILVDVGQTQPRLVFVEVVATDGPVTATRKAALMEIAVATGFPADRISFLTAFADRADGAFRKSVDSLAWGAYAWFMSEPERLLELMEVPRPLGH